MSELSPQEEKDALRALIGSAGWSILTRIAAAQVERRTNEAILNPLPGWDAVLAEQFVKGEIAGIRTFMNLPRMVIETEDALKEAERDGSGDPDNSPDD